MKKKYTAVMLGIAFIMLCVSPARAAEAEPETGSLDAPLTGLGVIFSQDEAENLQISAAIGFTDGTDTIFISDTGTYAEGFSDYFLYISEEEAYQMDYYGGYGDFPLEGWDSSDYPSGGYFELAPAKKRQAVTVCYINTEAEWDSRTTTITDIYADGDYAYFSTDFDPAEVGLYPAAVIDAEGQLVGILTSDDKMVSTDTTVINGVGKLAAVLAVIVVAALLILVIVLKKQKRKKTDAAGPAAEPVSEEWKWSQQETDTLEETESFGGTESFGETIEKTTPITEPLQEDSGSMKYIRAVGGYMNGRVYEILQGEILFGRDISCMVRYAREAENAKGISRIHCKLYWENGALWLLDMDSTYGTFLSGYGRLQNGVPVQLKKGSVFYLADKTNGFEIC